MLFKRCDCPSPNGCRHFWWYKFELHFKRYERSTRSSNKQQAGRIEARRRTTVLDGKDEPIVRATSLQELIHSYTGVVEKEHRTAGKTIRILKNFQAMIGNPDIKDISTFLIEKWKRQRVNDVSQSTVNRELTVLRGLFSRAVKWQLLKTSPLPTVDNYDVDDVRIRVLSEEELSRLHELPERERLLCRATVESLARISELLTLQPNHIGPSWVERHVKGGKVIRVQVSQCLREQLVVGISQFKGLTQQSASTAVIRALRKVGIHGASHHTMRHTGITLMLEAGINPNAIAELAGWTSLKMLKRYGHVRDAEVRRAVEVVAQKLDQNRAPVGVAGTGAVDVSAPATSTVDTSRDRATG